MYIVGKHFIKVWSSEYRIKRGKIFCAWNRHMIYQTRWDSNDSNCSSLFPEHYLGSLFPVSVWFEFPLLFWLIHLQQSQEHQQVIILLLHVKQKPSQPVRMKWGDGTISRNKPFSFCLIVWKEKTTVAQHDCLTKLLISFLSAEEVSRRGRCVWFGGQSHGEQDVQLAETWK